MEEATALALQHQLLTPYTNYLVVAEREVKADDLPELHTVPQMLAAGWGGTGVVADRGMNSLVVGAKASKGSAFDSVMFSCRTSSAAPSQADAMSSAGMDKYDIPAFLRRQTDDVDDFSSAAGEHFQSSDAGNLVGKLFNATRESIQRIGAKVRPQFHAPIRSERLPALPVDAVRSLPDFLWALETSVLAQGHPNPLARIDDLATWGVAPEIVADLRALVASGSMESVVVAAFLTAVCRSALRSHLNRQIRIKVLAIAKKDSPDAALVARFIDALAGATEADWNWRPLTLDPVVQP